MKLMVEYDESGKVTSVMFVNPEIAEHLERAPEPGRQMVYADPISLGLPTDLARLRGEDLGKYHKKLCDSLRVENGTVQVRGNSQTL
jgi:hypothetical protein